jgi:hypothetical protein
LTFREQQSGISWYTPTLGRILRRTEADLVVGKKRNVAEPFNDETHSSCQHLYRLSEMCLTIGALSEKGPLVRE